MTMKVKWIDSGKEPKSKPNPNYPYGIDVVAARPGRKTCTQALPYPAKRIGTYVVECSVCTLRVVVSTAGRPDDPRSVTMECKATRQ